MIEYRPAARLGRTEIEGLRSQHHFCFASYQDPARMDWGRLRLLSRHRLARGASYGPVHHFNMDILLLPLEGDLSLRIEGGAVHEFAPGALLHVSAGTGAHYTISNCGDGDAEYLELWLVPDRSGEARAAVHRLSTAPRAIVASGFPGEAKPRLRSNARVLTVSAQPGETVTLPESDMPYAYATLLAGGARSGDTELSVGDALAIQREQVSVEALTPMSLLLIGTY